jgi:hypothetical protein
MLRCRHGERCTREAEVGHHLVELGQQRLALATCIAEQAEPGIGLPVSCSEMKIAGMV